MKKLLFVVLFAYISSEEAKMRKFRNDKLWRDKMIQVLEGQGSKIHWRYLDDIEFDHQLRLKIIEEANEVAATKNNNELIEELADVLEIIDSFCDLYKIDFEDIKNAQIKKQFERGGFTGRKFVTIAEHPLNSPGEKYCLAAPDRYPEVCE